MRTSVSAPTDASATPIRPPIADEQQRLGQHLPHQPHAARAERDAQRHLVLPRRRARQQHARDVRAGNQQEQRDDGHQHEQRGGESIAQRGESRGRRLQLDGEAARERRRPTLREVLEAVAVEDAHLGQGLLDGDTGPQTGQHADAQRAVHPAARLLEHRFHRRRQPHAGR